MDKINLKLPSSVDKKTSLIGSSLTMFPLKIVWQAHTMLQRLHPWLLRMQDAQWCGPHSEPLTNPSLVEQALASNKECFEEARALQLQLIWTCDQIEQNVSTFKAFLALFLLYDTAFNADALAKLPLLFVEIFRFFMHQLFWEFNLA